MSAPPARPPSAVEVGTPLTAVWFRRDLRLEDHPALDAAVRRGAVLPLYVHDATSLPGSASGWWLHHSLKALEGALCKKGVALQLLQGDPIECLPHVVRQAGVSAIYWNHGYSPAEAAQEARVRYLLEADGVEVRTFKSGLLFEPDEVCTRQGGPFKVFTPFWRQALTLSEGAPVLPAPRSLRGPDRSLPGALTVEDLKLPGAADWAAGFAEEWTPGEAGAKKRLNQLLAGPLDQYDRARDLPAEPGTSRLSPHLHYGEISVRQVCAAVTEAMADGPVRAAEVFLSQLGWREFAHHLLHYFPHTLDQPLRSEFKRFPWRNDPAGWKAWTTGRTGFPLVDAGMRQLWRTGWMHNRVRMIAASFLVKDLLISWQDGAAWFADTLVDADAANNILGWQWTAGCGADAAPYFRVFNPARQGQRFDLEGTYIRRWIPELREFPARWIHAPHEAPESAREQYAAGYPAPIIDHAAARLRALEAYASIRR